MASTLASFGCLDELTQVIYQGINRFVLLSFVNDQEWTIKLGLAGTEGRWWSGSWNESDIFAVVGPKPSTTILEKFAQKLADSFIQGELFISDWSTSPHASIKLTLAPGSKKPMQMPLNEISAEQAASFASDIFLEIAIRAKSRQCRLHDSGYVTPGRASSTAQASPSKASGSKRQDMNDSSDEPEAKPPLKNKRPIENSKGKVQELSQGPEPKSKSVKAAPRAIKGASLANPNKKARKYQAIEFGSDDED
ncbi:hypothetical protein L218DRAFT_994586 [Marasmius fiardii PR-910]|nr:hypothetical protein L218DRAFT_994586 [Marasmius fiardii PR-910]